MLAGGGGRYCLYAFGSQGHFRLVLIHPVPFEFLLTFREGWGGGGGAKTQSQIEDRDSVSFRDSVSLRRGAENV